MPQDAPAENGAESPAETPAENAAESPAETPAESPAESPAQKLAHPPAARFADLRAEWAARLSRAEMGRLAYGLAVGGAGGLAASAAGVPLAWMLGPLFACMAFAVAGQPVMVPVWLRTLFMALIGLFLGESFTAETAAQITRWPVTIAMAVLYVPVGGAVCYALLRHGAGMTRATALLSGLPGGVTAVALFADGLGGDERRVALGQSLRVAFVVLLAPAVAFGWLGLPPPSAAAHGGAGLIGAGDAAILGVGSLAIWAATARLGWPLPYLIGPLLASAALRLTGVVEGALPLALVEASLLVCGASIGTRFAGAPLRMLASAAWWSLWGTLALMAITGIFAFGAHWTLGTDLFAALLAFAPGGVAEMSLIAIAIDADPAFVAAHHMARIFAILFALPALAGPLGRFMAPERE
jgi:hypothetical protein